MNECVVNEWHCALYLYLFVFIDCEIAFKSSKNKTMSQNGSGDPVPMLYVSEILITIIYPCLHFAHV